MQQVMSPIVFPEQHVLKVVPTVPAEQVQAIEVAQPTTPAHPQLHPKKAKK